MASIHKLRVYHTMTPQHKLYCDMYQYQTLPYVIKKQAEYTNLNNSEMTINTALTLLDSFIDPSDPDVDVANSVHAYQTAERIRKKYPNNKELQVVGLIHDLGKVLFSYGEPNWAVVGDTFVLGCEYPTSMVYYEDMKKQYQSSSHTGYGIYEVGCGLDNLTISFGHDEYLYQVLCGNSNHRITRRYMDVIRYHSLYPWHTGGAYKEFMVPMDEKILQDVNEFNSFDLYSKEDSVEITPAIKQYYNTLLDRFFFGKLRW
jgi:inositol oxygenase